MASEVMGKVKPPSPLRVIAVDSPSQAVSAVVVAAAAILVFAMVYPPTQITGWLLYSGAGVALLVSSAILAWRIRLISNLVQNGVEVTAKVTHSEARTFDGAPGVDAELTYDLDGRSYTVKRSFVLENFQTGNQVVIVTDPKKPKRFVLRSDFYWRPGCSGKSDERLAALRLPADEESLWPKGVLLQLEGIVDSMRQKDVSALILANGRLVVGRRPEFPENDGSGYSFSTEPLLNEQPWPTIDITRVDLAPSIIRDPLTVWVRARDGRETRVMKASIIGVPSTIMDVASAGVSRGAIPTDGKQLTPERLAMLGLQVLVAEMEKQFRRTAPQAQITVKGELMPQEILRKLIR